MDVDAESPGWSAIEKAFTAIYGTQEPTHWASAGDWRFGGEIALRGISAYRQEGGARPHWHFVTFGLSELFDKVSEDADRSGYGFELTLRVASDDAEHPPVWPVGLLQSLAGYVLQTGHPFSAGHTFNLQGPITDVAPTGLTGLVFTPDRSVKATSSRNGRVAFLQLVGLTEDERAAAKAWSTDGLLGLLGERDPLLVTDLDRESLLTDPQMAQRIEAGAAAQGSTMAALLVPGLRWEGMLGAAFTLDLPSAIIEDFKRLIAGRLLHGRPLSLAAPDQDADEQVRFVTAATPGVEDTGGLLEIRLTPPLVETLRQALQPKAGVHRLQGLGALTLRVSD
ncbi:MAG TPA: suppressor of fused domain protein [Myxococcaceae bacterium]|nr:suppressor of fused domain protein [Myxococcaceae bacterium]